MADSPNINDLILEVAVQSVEEQRLTLTTEIQTGSITRRSFDEQKICTQQLASNPDFNSFTPYAGGIVQHYKYLNPIGIQWLIENDYQQSPYSLPNDTSTLNLNGLMYRVDDDPAGLPWFGYGEFTNLFGNQFTYNPQSGGSMCFYNPNSIIAFTLDSNIIPGTSSLFNGNTYSMDSENYPTDSENRASENRENTEQGRILYARGIPNTWAAGFTFSFEILEGFGQTVLVRAVGRGKESTLSAIAQTLGSEQITQQTSYGFLYNGSDLVEKGIPVPEQYLDNVLNWFQTVDFWSSFNFTVSPWEHSYLWEYIAGAIKFDSTRQGRHLSGGEGWDVEVPMAYQDAGLDGIQGSEDDNYSAIPTNMTFGGGYDSGGALPAFWYSTALSQRYSNKPYSPCQNASTGGKKINITINELNNCTVQILCPEENVIGAGQFDDLEFAMSEINFEKDGSGYVYNITEPGFTTVVVPFYDNVIQTTGLVASVASVAVKPENDSDYGSFYPNCYKRKRIASYTESLLKIKPIDESQPYSAIIGDLRIYNAGYTTVEKSIPITQEIEKNLIESRGVENYEYLDILDVDKVPLSLNFNSANVKQPGKRSSGFSKTFELPANHHNQRILKSMTADGSVRKREDISWRKARIKAKGIYVFEGYARIEQMSTGKGGAYKCHIIEDPSFWPQRLGDTKICDLDFNITQESSDGKHFKNYDNITQSWSKTVDQIPYVYPLISYGEWSNGNNTTISQDDLHPALYVKAIVDAIFSQIENNGQPTPYTVDSNFFNTDFFKKLIVPYTSGEDYRDNIPTFGEDGDYYTTASLAAEESLPTIPATGTGGNTYRRYYPSLNPVLNAPAYIQNTSNFVNGGYQVPFTGRYRLYYSARVKLKQNGFGDNKGRWSVWLYVNGCVIDYNPPFFNQCTPGPLNMMGNPTDSTEPPYNGIGSQNAVWNIEADGNNSWNTHWIDIDIDLVAGDEVQVAFGGLNFAGLGNAGPLNKVKGWIKDQDFVAYPLADNAYTPPTAINLEKILPCTKQIDFIKGLTQLFNLHWTADENTRTVFVEPYDDFYGSGKVLDWSKKIDKSNWSDKFIIEEMAKVTEFKYKIDDSDTIVTERYNTSMNTELWSLDIENGDLYRKETFALGTDVFSPTFRIKGNTGFEGDRTIPTNPSANICPIVPCMWSGDPMSWGWFNGFDRPDNSTKFNIRILNWYGLSTETNMWSLADDLGNPAFFPNYPYAHTYNYNHASSSTYEDNLSWYNIGSGSTFQRGLFDRYYGGYYQKINGGAALRTCQMNLTPTDIATFDYRDIIKIEMDGGISTYWTVNKIVDYKPGKNELTKVELVEWKRDVKFRKGGIVLSLPPNTNYGSLTSTPNQTGKIRVNNKTYLVTKDNHSILLEDGSPDKSTTVNLKNNLTIDILNSLPRETVVEPLVYTNKNGITNQSYDFEDKNSVNDSSVAFGKRLVAGKGQVVLGCGNEYKPSDIFQVGGGYYDERLQRYIKQNVISVSKNGDINFYGGEVVANFTHGENTITGDVYFIDKSGKKQKLYLSSTPDDLGDTDGSETIY